MNKLRYFQIKKILFYCKKKKKKKTKITRNERNCNIIIITIHLFDKNT